MPSPHPIPTNIKKLRGTDRPDRGVENEIQPEQVNAIPTPPEKMGEHGKEMWYTFCAEALNLGLLTKIGLPQIERYCDFYDIYVVSKEHAYDRKGKIKPVIKLNNGAFAQNPYIKSMRDAAAEMKKLEDVWGLSPSSQTKIPARSQDEEFDEFTLQ